MKDMFKNTVAALAIAGTMAAASSAEAQPRRHNDNNDAVVGAIIGGIAGYAIGRAQGNNDPYNNRGYNQGYVPQPYNGYGGYNNYSGAFGGDCNVPFFRENGSPGGTYNACKGEGPRQGARVGGWEGQYINPPTRLEQESCVQTRGNRQIVVPCLRAR